MTDKTFYDSYTGATKKIRSMGDGTDADVVALNDAAGFVATASFTPSALAYGAGDVIDVAKQFSFVDWLGNAIPAGSLIRITTAILKIDQTALQASEGAYSLQCYSVTPPSAQVDNAAWSLASGDLSAYRGSISLGTPVDLGSACYVRMAVDVDINLSASSIFAQLVTTPAFMPGAVARQVFLYGVRL